MGRNKFQRTLAGREDRNDSAARKLLSRIEKLPEAKRLAVWTIGVETSEFYRDMCKKAQYAKMYVTEREIKWLEDIFKRLKEVKV